MRGATATGCYHLVYHLRQDTRVRVGSLGSFDLPAGWYVYTGSAFGPGGLAPRVTRHRAHALNGRPAVAGSASAPHWHVDYLAAVADLVDVVLLPDRERRECEHARALRALDGASEPVPRFGASDCRCPAHLVRFARRPHLAQPGTADHA